MKTRRVMVSGLTDSLRVSSTCPVTENKRSRGHEVSEITKKRRANRESVGKWCVSHVVCIPGPPVQEQEE